MMKKIICLVMFLLIPFALNGCRIQQKTLSGEYPSHIDSYSTAAVRATEALNAATVAVAQLTVAAVTETAPVYATDAAQTCSKIVEMIEEDTDYYWIRPGAQLGGCEFSELDLFGMDLSFADLREANLTRANLSQSTLIGADLSFSTLSNTNLRFAKLNQAVLRHADLRGADLSGADLTGADLSGANITQEQLDLTASLEGAILPDLSEDD